MSQLAIFDLMESLEHDEDSDLKSMLEFNFFDAVSPDIIACISDDFKQTLLGNGSENLILEN